MKIQTKIKPLLTIALSLALVSLLSPAQVFGDCMADCENTYRIEAEQTNCKRGCTRQRMTPDPQGLPNLKSNPQPTQDKNKDSKTEQPANDAKQNQPKAK